MAAPLAAASDHRPRRERCSRTSASMSNRYLRSSTTGAPTPTAANGAATNREERWISPRGFGVTGSESGAISASSILPRGPRTRPRAAAGLRLRPCLLRADPGGAGTLLASQAWFTAPDAEEPQGED